MCIGGEHIEVVVDVVLVVVTVVDDPVEVVVDVPVVNIVEVVVEVVVLGVVDVVSWFSPIEKVEGIVRILMIARLQLAITTR